jgi:hypothetical protein
MASQSIPATVLTFPSKPQIPDALALEAEGIAQLSRALAKPMHNDEFDRLTIAERMEVVDAAILAWFTVKGVMDGTAAPIPGWLRQCLTFSGPYDLAWLEPHIERGSEWQ